MILVIATQDYENYAAHGGFTGEFRWKAKGGSEYKITGVPADANCDDVVALAREQIEEDSPYFQTTIVGYGLEADDYLSWFERSQLDYEGEIQFPEPQIAYENLVDKQPA